ncbi:hypothetical protein MUK42_34676 [Musa troglodytarum]|uniref:Uncharacterized protein n=1 Tax=Musa troglodytarum TaxID=320322 RepID=A0A9E7JC44_9LILI|nr:hypothetical protein MUK42_34676 [Musa troglodytarum]
MKGLECSMSCIKINMRKIHLHWRNGMRRILQNSIRDDKDTKNYTIHVIPSLAYLP